MEQTTVANQIHVGKPFLMAVVFIRGVRDTLGISRVLRGLVPLINMQILHF